MDDNMSLMDRLNERYPKFSKGQKRIADFIRENYDLAASYTASKLGKEVGVSESTVVRFAYELDYDGYPELLKAIAATVRTHSTSIQRLETAYKRSEEKEDLVSSILNADRARLKETIAAVDVEKFNKAVDLIVNADSIYILGVRGTWYIAGWLGYYFRMIFDKVYVLEGNDSIDTLEQISRIKSNDCFIGISFPRYSRRTRTAMELAKNHGAKTIAITDSVQSPLYEHADYPLIVKSDVMAIVDSLTAPVSLINALIVAVCMREKDSLTDRLHVLEELWDQYKVYDDHVIE
ncbi:MAG: MurR/RpiR family transcriptional regulator [Lachnospiraceae bacterium]|nr:MurR/RpiR family transcriptional regulator [Lachnospiraceae bacterium]